MKRSWDEIKKTKLVHDFFTGYIKIELLVNTGKCTTSTFGKINILSLNKRLFIT